MPAHPTVQQSGVSLVELLVVMAVLGVLAGLAAPGLSGLIERHRVDTVHDELLASLQLARVEAIRQGIAIVMERQTGCGAALDSGRNWTCGWQLYADHNGNFSRDATSEPILQTGHLPPHTGLYKSANQPLSRVWADRFGQIQPLALHFRIQPLSGNLTNGGILCMGAGARFRWIRGASACT